MKGSEARPEGGGGGEFELTIAVPIYLALGPARRQINASPDEESGIGELLSTMGVRRPGLRIVSFEMPAKERSVPQAQPLAGPSLSRVELTRSASSPAGEPSTCRAGCYRSPLVSW